jgi:2-polyprenyl-6-methoxyphenol hydroxylase-like FAD-dependent oxidoreductase
VIGADGLHSATRRLAFGSADFVRFRDHYFAFADTDASLAFAADTSWRIPALLDAGLADPEFYFDALSTTAGARLRNAAARLPLMSTMAALGRRRVASLPAYAVA